LSEPLIRVRDLTRDYRLMDKREGVMGGFVDLLRPRWRTLRAVADVSFDIAPGEMVGYIGANGAGKSTTIKMLTGILTPTGGEVTVGGMVPWKQRRQYTRHIGAVFGQRSSPSACCRRSTRWTTPPTPGRWRSSTTCWA